MKTLTSNQRSVVEQDRTAPHIALNGSLMSGLRRDRELLWHVDRATPIDPRDKYAAAAEHRAGLLRKIGSRYELTESGWVKAMEFIAGRLAASEKVESP